MPELRWIYPEPENPSVREVTRGSRVKVGKPLWMWGDGYADPPKQFRAFHRFGFVMRAYCDHKERPSIAPAAKPHSVRPHENGWVSTMALGRTPGRRISWILYFEDDAGNVSDDIRVSSLVEFQPPEAQAAGFGLSFPIRFVTVIDPVIELSVLAPWNREEWRPYMDELIAPAVAGGEAREEVLSVLEGEMLEGYLPEEQPEGWEFVFDETRFELGDGEEAETTLNVSMPSVGATALVVQARAVIEGEELLSVSDLILLRKPEDGSATAELLGGDEGDGGGGEGLDVPEEQELAGTGPGMPGHKPGVAVQAVIPISA